METAPLKSFATWARRELITQVSARLTAVLAPASPERVENQRAVTMLERDIAAAGGGAKGKDAITDKVAYTWFNRIIALRFMDANGYTGVGIVSPARGQQTGQPEVLADAKRGSIDPAVVRNQRTLDMITGLLDGTRPSTDAQGEAYTLLLAEYCRYWNRSMPFMFEREGDYTELLIPANLLAADSILSKAASTLTAEVCRDVEVIGWLYQFYISERKDEVFAGFKKGKKAGAEEIPAATQLFTPHWIVRYLVENSLGRLWMLNHPSSRLTEQMDYYIAPVDEGTDLLKVTSPEELTVIDPACGSGHMLTHAFDLLYAIYEEEGYAPSEIPELILTHNLYGTEIDPRAGALAAFALTMKARARQRTFLNRQVAPKICVLKPLHFLPDELDILRPPTIGRAGWSRGDETIDIFCPTREEVGAFWNQFQHADTFGSLLHPDADFIEPLRAHVETLEEGTLGAAELREAAEIVLDQAEYLSRRYHVAIANPPYMGGKQMSALLSQFMKDEYPTGKADLFAAFIERCTGLARPRGAVAMITMQSWMFLSSYEKLRASLLTHHRITSMLHLGARAFNSIGGEVVSSAAFVLEIQLPGDRGAVTAEQGVFVRLVDGSSEAEKVTALRSALAGRDKGSGYHLASGADFAAIPGSPIVYWLSEKMRGAFQRTPDTMPVLPFREGMSTSDNERFVREWHEVSRNRISFESSSQTGATKSGATWFPFDQGGAFRKWWGNQESVVNWARDGDEIRGELPKPRINNPDFFFKPHLTISKITSGPPSFRIFPSGFALASVSKCAFFDSPQSMYEVCGLLNSDVARWLLAAVSPTLSFLASDLENLPLRVDRATGEQSDPERVLALVDNSRHDWDSVETSWSFRENPLTAIAKRQ